MFGVSGQGYQRIQLAGQVRDPYGRSGMEGRMDNEAAKLAACYRNVLELAKRQGMTSIAFPSISTGAYRFPVDKAAKIALNEISKFLTKDRDIESISIVCFDQRTYDMYKRLM